MNYKILQFNKTKISYFTLNKITLIYDEAPHTNKLAALIILLTGGTTAMFILILNNLFILQSDTDNVTVSWII